MVEKDERAFGELSKVAARFPDIEVIPHPGDFHEALPFILAGIPPDVFAFSLIDPKGWSIDLQRITPLLARPNSEVVINLMYDFINRFIDHPNERIMESLNRTIPGPEWREALNQGTADLPAAREALVIGTFVQALKTIGDYRYVPSLKVRRPGHERTLYHLVYGTRSAAGLAVFRESQMKALQGEAEVQSGIKRGKREERTGMLGLFSPDMEAANDPVAQFLKRERQAAQTALLEALIAVPAGLLWRDLWPQVLERFAVTPSDLGRDVNALRKLTRLEVPGWSSERRQIPEDDYLIRARG